MFEPVVEHGIPIPPRQRVLTQPRDRIAYNLHRLSVGDSVFVADRTRRISLQVVGARIKKMGRSIIIRNWVQDGVEGLRVWRVK